MMTKPLSANTYGTLHAHLTLLYGLDKADQIMPRLIRILDAHQASTPAPPPQHGPLTERDVVLITYPDHVQQAGERPLQTLKAFLERMGSDLLSGIHLLPFFPYSSDDGFSVIDHRQVRPDLGDWDDITQLASHSRLMIDAVVNHVSKENAWFQAFLRSQLPYSDYFITVDPEADLSSVVRPRDLPLLTPFPTSEGTKHVWTTFSADQADLNFANPAVLLEIVDLLLFYIRQGAQFIRLDAIAFIWKTLGTPCIHLPQAHHVVKLIRTLLDAIAPWVFLITETNVPHNENLSYFGDGADEAHVVYQFALPPLVLHTFLTGNASRLTAWAQDLRLPSDRVTFFNFLASHDGVGLRPAHELLSTQEIEDLVRWTEMRGGAVSYRSVGEQHRTPYELNITYVDALAPPEEDYPTIERWAARFLCSQAIMLSMAGLPGIYFHSLFGSRNDVEAVRRSGNLRAINRQKLSLYALESELADTATLRSQIYTGYARLLHARRSQLAFQPLGPQQILDLNPSVFSVLRHEPQGGNRLLCLHEVTGRMQSLAVDLRESPHCTPHDVLSGTPIDLSACSLSPYQVRWISLDSPIKTKPSQDETK
jgi:glycosidase